MKSTKLVLLATLALASTTQHLNAADSWWSGIRTRAGQAWAATTQAAQRAKEAARTNYEEWQRSRLARTLGITRSTLTGLAARLSALEEKAIGYTTRWVIAPNKQDSLKERDSFIGNSTAIRKYCNDAVEKLRSVIEVTRDHLNSDSQLQKDLAEAQDVVEAATLSFEKLQQRLLIEIFKDLGALAVSAAGLPGQGIEYFKTTIGTVEKHLKQVTRSLDLDAGILFEAVDNIIHQLAATTEQYRTNNEGMGKLNKLLHDEEVYIFFKLDSNLTKIKSKHKFLQECDGQTKIETLIPLATLIALRGDIDSINALLQERFTQARRELLTKIEHSDTIPNKSELKRNVEVATRPEELIPLMKKYHEDTAKIVATFQAPTFKRIQELAGQFRQLEETEQHLNKENRLLIKLSSVVAALGESGLDIKEAKKALDELEVEFRQRLKQKQQEEAEAYKRSYTGKASETVRSVGGWFGSWLSDRPTAESSDRSKLEKVSGEPDAREGIRAEDIQLFYH